MIRQISSQCKVSDRFPWQSLPSVLPASLVRDVLAECGRQTPRERKLTLEAVVWILIGMHLYASLSLGRVLAHLSHRFRLLGADPGLLPGESALTYRRYQLGARPLRRLFHRLCVPLATEQTPGAFLFGLRLMALDGHITHLPDTPANAAYFGRKRGDHAPAPFPQVLGMYLCECGTHAFVDAGFWPANTSEHKVAPRLLRSVEEGMLVLWDRGLYSYDLLTATLAKKAHVLVRLGEQVKPKRVCQLPDGTWLARLVPSDPKRRKKEEVIVRLIQYTLTDPALPGYNQRHRLITSLLDPIAYPARDLCGAYHARWEEEIAFDEMETHQQRPDTLLRSKKPVGVVQELYALLIAHYLVRALMYQAAEQEQITPLRLSFCNALYLLGRAVQDYAFLPAKQHPHVHRWLLDAIAHALLPERRCRTNPRVVKRKIKHFQRKLPEHYKTRQPRHPFRDVVALI